MKEIYTDCLADKHDCLREIESILSSFAQDSGVLIRNAVPLGNYRRFKGRNVSIFRIRQSSFRELFAQRRKVTYQKYRINSTAVITSNLLLCTPETRPNCSTLNMKAVRTFVPKLARLSDLAEIWYTSKVKAKAIPVQGWTDPEGSRRLRFPDFMTIST